MTNEWILDVLTDLRVFADGNGMPQLAEHLDDARVLAASELADPQGRAASGGAADDTAVPAPSARCR